MLSELNKNRTPSCKFLAETGGHGAGRPPRSAARWGRRLSWAVNSAPLTEHGALPRQPRSIARRFLYCYEMGMGCAVEDYEWDGLRIPGRVIDITQAQSSEEPMRNLYRRWVQFMEAESWAELATWRYSDSTGGRLQRTGT